MEVLRATKEAEMHLEKRDLEWALNQLVDDSKGVIRKAGDSGGGLFLLGSPTLSLIFLFLFLIPLSFSLSTSLLLFCSPSLSNIPIVSSFSISLLIFFQYINNMLLFLIKRCVEDLEKAVTLAAEMHVESLLREQIDSKAVRIRRLLQAKPYLEEDLVAF